MVKRQLATGFALAVLALTTRAFAADARVQVKDSEQRALADAVVYALPDTPEHAKPHTVAIIDQIDKQFAPRIAVIETGTEIEFPNSDNIRHSVYSFSPAKSFELKLYAGKLTNPLLFDKSGLVTLGCNIHDQMAAWLLVVDTPFFGRTGTDGNVTLHDLPPGHYRLVAWYPSMSEAGEAREFTIGATPGSPQSFSLPVRPIGEQGL